MNYETVFGNWKKETKGMVVAIEGEVCPIRKEKMKTGEMTLVCKAKEESQVTEILTNCDIDVVEISKNNNVVTIKARRNKRTLY